MVNALDCKSSFHPFESDQSLEMNKLDKEGLNTLLFVLAVIGSVIFGIFITSVL